VYDDASRVVQTIQNCRTASGVPVATGCAAFDPDVPDRNVPQAIGYDALGRTFEMVDALGYVSRSTYDGLGRTIASIRNYQSGAAANSDTNVTTSQAYDALGRTVSSTDPLGVVTSQTYDALGRTVTATDGEQRVRRMGYDGAGAMRWSETPDGRFTVLLVDGLGRPTATIQNYNDGTVDGNEPVDQDLITETIYDLAGRVSATIDPAGRETRFTYDLRDNLRSVTENATSGTCALAPCNVTTSYTYDRAGNRISITDANTHTRTLTYDAANRQRTSTDPLNQTTSYTYDRLGRMTFKDDPRGSAYDVTYTYDELNRPIGISAPEIDAPISMNYNALGWRTGLADGTGATSFLHDDLGRVISLTAPNTGTVGYGYNARGQRTQLTYPDSSVIDYAYWDDGQLNSVLENATPLAQYTYDPAGRLASVSRANGATTAYTYDGADRLRDLHTTADDATLAHFTYDVDRLGMRRSVTETLAVAPEGLAAEGLVAEGFSSQSALQTLADGYWNYNLTTSPAVLPVVDLTEVSRYTESNDRPCFGKGVGACRFETRTITIESNGTMLESITAYNRYWNFDVSSGALLSTGTLRSVPRYNNGPCKDQPISGCTFDSRTVFTDANGHQIEAITYTLTDANPPVSNAWNYNVTTNTVIGSGKIALRDPSIVRYNATTPSGPCNESPTKTIDQVCVFDAREIYQAANGAWVETIIAYGKIWHFNVATLSAFSVLPYATLQHNVNLTAITRYASAPCAGTSGQGCRFDTYAVLITSNGDRIESVSEANQALQAPPTATPTRTPTRTATPVPPTATPTRTPTRTATPVPPTATPTRTPTRTATPVPPTATPTRTPTRTATPVPPTATALPTSTPVPPTATALPTSTPIPPTATALPTSTPIPPTATALPTSTPVPPTATALPTSTPIPPTATALPTSTPVRSRHAPALPVPPAPPTF
jgi:YD repeat-containing protein